MESRFNTSLALDSFDTAPDLAEAWCGRAQALSAGRHAVAARDIQETLKREPRHIMALQNLSRVSEGSGHWRGALPAWEQVLAMNPKAPNGQTRLRDLRRRALGEEL